MSLFWFSFCPMELYQKLVFGPRVHQTPLLKPHLHYHVHTCVVDKFSSLFMIVLRF